MSHPLLYVMRCSSLFMKHVFAIEISKVDEKSKMQLPYVLTTPRPYPPSKPSKPHGIVYTCPFRSPHRKIFSPGSIS